MYSSPPLIGTLLLPNNFVPIRQVSFGEREYYTHSWYLHTKNLSFLEGCPLQLKRGTTVYIKTPTIPVCLPLAI